MQSNGMGLLVAGKQERHSRVWKSIVCARSPRNLSNAPHSGVPIQAFFPFNQPKNLLPILFPDTGFRTSCHHSRLKIPISITVSH